MVSKVVSDEKKEAETRINTGFQPYQPIGESNQCCFSKITENNSFSIKKCLKKILKVSGKVCGFWICPFRSFG